MASLIHDFFKGACIYIPFPEKVNKKNRVASDKLLSLSENPRAETLLWHMYIRYLSLVNKKKKSNIIDKSFF